MNLTIGTAVMNARENGFVAAIANEDANVHMITANGFAPVTGKIMIVWESGHFGEVPNNLAEDWAEKAQNYHMDSIGAEAAVAMLAKAKAERNARVEEARKEREAKAEAELAFRDEIRDLIPADAKAVIIAELHVNASDSQSDYFAHGTTRTVILGFSTHTRNLFSEMRKAAANFAETADLATAGKDAEHRENYSMGAGYYLKAEGRHHDGWAIKKRTMHTTGNDIAAAVPFGEWAVPTAEAKEAPKAKAAPKAEAVAEEGAEVERGNGYTIKKHHNEKRGFDYFLCILADRVERSEFMALMDTAKRSRGWYARAWQGRPGGFAFKDLENAREFAASI